MLRLKVKYMNSSVITDLHKLFSDCISFHRINYCCATFSSDLLKSSEAWRDTDTKCNGIAVLCRTDVFDDGKNGSCFCNSCCKLHTCTRSSFHIRGPSVRSASTAVWNISHRRNTGPVRSALIVGACCRQVGRSLEQTWRM